MPRTRRAGLTPSSLGLREELLLQPIGQRREQVRSPTVDRDPLDHGIGRRSLPASDPLVLGVGGTTLSANPKTGAYIGETAWTDGGGGFSHLYAQPVYQDGVPGIAKTRGVPDVAGDADEAGGMARVDVYGDVAGLESDAGTSDSAPQRGGPVALADQYAHHDLGSVNPAIYSIARSSSYHTAFTTLRPVSTAIRPLADGTRQRAGEPPNAQALIPLLDRSTSPARHSNAPRQLSHGRWPTQVPTEKAIRQRLCSRVPTTARRCPLSGQSDSAGAIGGPPRDVTRSLAGWRPSA